MALSFLNKKIWHPGSFANIEKVWIAEQKHKEFERKAIENAKKVKEERAIEDLKKIQVENGLIPKSHLNRLDFMYQGPDCSNKLISAEEFLLGKSIEEEEASNKKKLVPVFQENYSNPINEAFTKVHEDPLYLIKKEEMRQRKEIEENPYKVKLLLKDLQIKKKEKHHHKHHHNDDVEKLNKELTQTKKKDDKIKDKELKFIEEKRSKIDKYKKYVDNSEEEEDSYQRHRNHSRSRSKNISRDPRKKSHSKYDKYRDSYYSKHEHEHRHHHSHKHN